jgi:hypothetical protein
MAEAAAQWGAERGPPAGATRYAAFISYSHADSEICDRLHRRLESYVVPRSLAGRTGPHGSTGRRLGKFFRDRVELGAHHDLGAEIREALDASAALIVLCSPKSAGSRYVEDEIRYFKSLGRAGQVYAAIISGEPHAAGKPGLSAADECFPRALIFRVGDGGALTGDPEASEPVAADLRDRKDGLENGSLKLIAGLLDVGLDDLVQRERQAERQRRLRANLIAGAMTVLAIGAGVGGVFAWINGETASRRANELAAANAELDSANARLKTTNDQLDTANRDLETQLDENRQLTTRMQSVIDEMGQIAASAPNAPERLLYLSAGARLGMSAASADQLARFESGEIRDFPQPTLDAPDRPGRRYVCLGVYCTAPFFSDDDIRRHLSSRFSPGQVERVLKVVAGKAAVATIADVRMSRREQIHIWGEYMLPAFVTMLKQQLPEAEGLPPDCFGALVSIVVHSGRLEPAIADPVREKRYSEVPSAIRASGDRLAARFSSNPRIAEIIRQRRIAAAELFEQGLRQPAAETPAETQE